MRAVRSVDLVLQEAVRLVKRRTRRRLVCRLRPALELSRVTTSHFLSSRSFRIVVQQRSNFKTPF